jgi:hypothetical protein
VSQADRIARVCEKFSRGELCNSAPLSHVVWVGWKKNFFFFFSFPLSGVGIYKSGRKRPYSVLTPAEYRCSMLGKGAFAFTILRSLFSISQDSYERKTPLKLSSFKNKTCEILYRTTGNTNKTHSRTKTNRKKAERRVNTGGFRKKEQAASTGR